MTGEASALHQVLTGGPTLFAIVRLNANDSERVMRAQAIIFAMLAMTEPAAAETVQLYAAGA